MKCKFEYLLRKNDMLWIYWKVKYLVVRCSLWTKDDQAPNCEESHNVSEALQEWLSFKYTGWVGPTLTQIGELRVETTEWAECASS